jgi:single-stranded DNA-binding protein
MNNYTLSGRIISSRPLEYERNGVKSNGLSIKVSVMTGQKSKVEGEYPPSMIVDVTIWDKLATVLEPKAVKGNFVVATGQLALPTIYTTKDGEPGVNMALHYTNDIAIIPQEGAAPAATVKDTSKKKETKTKNRVEEVSSESDDYDEIPF